MESVLTSFLILARKNEEAKHASKSVELRAVLERVHNLARHYVIEKDVSLAFYYHDQVICVQAVPSYVEQICLNLTKMR